LRKVGRGGTGVRARSFDIQCRCGRVYLLTLRTCHDLSPFLPRPSPREPSGSAVELCAGDGGPRGKRRAAAGGRGGAACRNSFPHRPAPCGSETAAGGGGRLFVRGGGGSGRQRRAGAFGIESSAGRQDGMRGDGSRARLGWWSAAQADDRHSAIAARCTACLASGVLPRRRACGRNGPEKRRLPPSGQCR
jgi:hypothetical protein